MRAFRILLSLPLLAVMALAPAAGQNAAPAYVEPPNLSALIAAASKEGVLDFAVGQTFGGATGVRDLQDGMNKLYHTSISVRYAPISQGTTFTRSLIQEVRAGQTASSDVMFTADNSVAVPYIQRVDWRKFAPNLPAAEMVYDDHAVKAMTTLHGFAYNTKVVPSDDVPKSFADMLKPEWKGKIATSPYQGQFINYLGLPNVFGPEKMLEYVKKFAGQISGIMTCGETDRVVSGEFAIFGVDCGDHETRLRQRKGEPIAEIYPSEGTQVAYVSPAIPLTARHPNAARLFIAFLLTRQGQDILWNDVGEDSDLLPGSHMGQIVADLRRKGVKIVEGPEGTGLDLKYPQLDEYTREISAIINQGR